MLDYWLRAPVVKMERLSRGQKSEVLGREIGYMGVGMKVIRFHRKLELLTMAEVNRDVGHSECVLRVSYQQMGTHS